MKTEIIAGLVVLAVGGMVAGAVWYTRRAVPLEVPRAQPAAPLPSPVPEAPKQAPAPSFESVVGSVSQGITALTGAFSAVFGAFA